MFLEFLKLLELYFVKIKCSNIFGCMDIGNVKCNCYPKN